MAMRTGAVVLMTAAMLQSGSAFAQQGFVGQWVCQTTFTEFNEFQTRTGGFVTDYMLAIYPDGTYEASGTMTSVAGYNQFQSQGNWSVQGQAVVARGPQYDTVSPVPGYFAFTAQLMPDGTLMYTEEQPDPTMTRVMARTNIYCERRG